MLITDPVDIIGQRLCVWGSGVEGNALLAYLRQKLGIDDEIVLLDQQHNSPESRALQEARHAELTKEYGPLRVESDPSAVACDVVFRSPGLSPYSEHWQRLLERNPDIGVSSSTALWLANPQQRDAAIAVTGSKGKSTCVALLKLILSALGHEVSSGGNSSEVALLDVEHNEGALHVVEISSFQAVELDPQLKPAVVLLTNIYGAHTDWHGSHEQYVRDKLKLCADVDGRTTVCNARDENSARCLGDHQHVRWYGDERGFHIRGQDLYMNDRQLGALSNPRLQNPSGHDNVCGVLAALCSALDRAGKADPDWEVVLDTINTFGGIAYRQEYLGQYGAHHYIDDGAATVPEATLAAIELYRKQYGDNITLLLGGQQHTQDYASLVDVLSNGGGMRVVLLPDNGAEIAKLFAPEACELFVADDLAQGVAWAQTHTPEGGAILLSPAAPSLGRFANYLERSQLFRTLASQKVGI